jgi:arabinogalactan oligomer / maltooligosaccharide transport system substrate-binding protein
MWIEIDHGQHGVPVPPAFQPGLHVTGRDPANHPCTLCDRRDRSRKRTAPVPAAAWRRAFRRHLPAFPGGLALDTITVVPSAEAIGTSWLNNGVALAGAVAGLVAAVSTISGAIWAVLSKRRAAAARLVQADWGAADPGVVVLNESGTSFRRAVVTVTCGEHERAQKYVGFVEARKSSLVWSSGQVHRSIDAWAGAPQESRASNHDDQVHDVEVTFSYRKKFWHSSDGSVERVRSLVIWAEGTRAATLERFFGHRSAFHRTYPISVEVQPFDRTEELEHAFTQLARTDEPPSGRAVPDIVVGPHDWIGRVTGEGSVAQPPFSSELSRFDPKARAALSRHGRLYALPYVFDSVALIRNDTLAGPGDLPRDIDEVIKSGQDALGAAGGLPLALQVGEPNQRGDAGDPYHLWPLFTSAGGSFFGLRAAAEESGVPPVAAFADQESWRAGFIEAFTHIARLGVGRGGSGVLRPDIGRDEALQAFRRGEAPYLICSSRALKSIREQGMKVTVGAVPPLGPHDAQPLVSVYGFYIYRVAPNQSAARDLLASYVSNPQAGLDLNRIQPLVPVQRKAMTQLAGQDPQLRPYIDRCRVGMIMPSYPEMRDAWQLLGMTEYRVLAGDGDPAQIAADAADRGWQLLARARGS